MTGNFNFNIFLSNEATNLSNSIFKISMKRKYVNFWRAFQFHLCATSAFKLQLFLLGTEKILSVPIIMHDYWERKICYCFLRQWHYKPLWRYVVIIKFINVKKDVPTVLQISSVYLGNIRVFNNINIYKCGQKSPCPGNEWLCTNGKLFIIRTEIVRSWAYVWKTWI